MIKPIAIFSITIALIIIIFYRWKDPYQDSLYYAYNNNVYEMLSHAIDVDPSLYIDSVPQNDPQNYIAFYKPTTITRFLQSPAAIPSAAAKKLCTIKDTRHGNTLLHWAAKSLAMDVLHFLLALQCPVNVKNAQGSTPLHWAATSSKIDPQTYAEYEHIATLAHNAQYASDIDLETDNNTTGDSDEMPNNNGTISESDIEPPTYTEIPLNPAMTLLIEHGADVNLPNHSNDTALHFAVSWQSVSAVYTLLKASAHTDVINHHKNTPVHQLPKDCNEHQACWKIISMLVAVGVDLHAPNKFGRKPIDYLDFAKIPPLLAPDDEKFFQSLRQNRPTAPHPDRDHQPSRSPQPLSHPEPNVNHPDSSETQDIPPLRRKRIRDEL